MRQVMVAGNWKMHRTAAETIDVLQQLRHAIDDDGIDLAQVMIAAQKSSVSFQAMVEVRNKLVEAYKDVMNMPV